MLLSAVHFGSAATNTVDRATALLEHAETWEAIKDSADPLEHLFTLFGLCRARSALDAALGRLEQALLAVLDTIESGQLPPELAGSCATAYRVTLELSDRAQRASAGAEPGGKLSVRLAHMTRKAAS